ncbi:RNase P modulator RnpM [Lacticigenium naphthae]|uniref:RNase P modulator RnpM n=1 Tax=Lacticigenium naphthae TaxID=515351 RepID=UPI000417BC25|nr:YlxR family RNase P modulator [Lacticigenium naphthae]
MLSKKIPMRKCVVSNEMKSKKEMIRIVKNKEGEISLDPSGKKNGRGAYLSIEPDLVRKAKEQKILERVFNTMITEEFYQELLEYVEHKKARQNL